MAQETNNKIGLDYPQEVAQRLGDVAIIDLTDGQPTPGSVIVNSANHAARAIDMARDFSGGDLKLLPGPTVGSRVSTWTDGRRNTAFATERDGIPDQLTIRVPAGK